MRMMKVVLLVTALVVGASAAHAGTMTFGLGGGIASPSGDFGKVYKMGFNGNVFGDYWVKDNYAIGVDIDGSFFKAKDDVINAFKSPGYQDPKVTANLIGFGVHGVLALPMKDSPMQPWLTAGIGMYNGKSKVEGVNPGPPNPNGDTSDTKLGFHGGVGVDFKAGDAMKFGVNAKYHNVQTEGQSSAYLTAGVALTFMTTGTTR